MKKRYLEVSLLLVSIAVFGRFATSNRPVTASPSPSKSVAATRVAPSPLRQPSVDELLDSLPYTSDPPRLLPGVANPTLTKIVKARMTTDLGELQIDIYPEAAPNAAKHFEELVRAGYYDETPLYRVLPHYVAVFGINSRPQQKVWKDKLVEADPSLYRLEAGTLAFARNEDNNIRTEVFFNLNDTSYGLAPLNYTTFAKVTKGFELAKKFKEVAYPSLGLNEDALWKDTPGYLKSLTQKPTMILKAEILE